MKSGGDSGGIESSKSISLFLAVLMTCGTAFSLSSFIAQTTIAPPLAGNLDIVFYDMAPDTHTYPGDNNVTMIGLDMTASLENVQVISIDFTLGGTVTPAGIDSVALTGYSYSDVEGNWHLCEFARTTVTAPTFAVPGTGNLEECAGTSGRDFLVTTSSTRSVHVRLSVSDVASVNTTIQLSVTGINTDGSVVGGTGTTALIWVFDALFKDDIESGLNGWTASGGDGGGTYPNGLWHLSSGEEGCANSQYNEDFYSSPTTSWWYGHKHEDPWNPGTFICTYATWIPGDPMNFTMNWGNLTSPWINATGVEELYITFWHLLSRELYMGVDIAALWLYDGQWHQVSPTYHFTDDIWQRVSYNLSAYAGRHVKLEFRFDTIDRHNNLFLGWFIDDVALYGANNRWVIPPGPPTIIKAVLSGPNHENVRISWELSMDDGAPLFGVNRYDIYRGDIYDGDGIGYALHDSVPNGTSEYIDVLAGEGDLSNHFYIICAVDNNGLGECAKDQAGKSIRTLVQGMNLVSIPLIQWDESFATVLQTVDYDDIWVYDSTSAGWSWQMVSKPYMGALLQLDHTMGFWVDVAQNCNLTVAGIVPKVTEIVFHEGWNLIGFPSFSQSPTVGNFRAIVPVEEIEGYDPLAPPYFLRKMADVDVFQTGFGYWVKVFTSSSWMVINS
jgi:hypothetical protein